MALCQPLQGWAVRHMRRTSASVRATSSLPGASAEARSSGSSPPVASPSSNRAWLSSQNASQSSGAACDQRARLRVGAGVSVRVSLCVKMKVGV